MKYLILATALVFSLYFLAEEFAPDDGKSLKILTARELKDPQAYCRHIDHMIADVFERRNEGQAEHRVAAYYARMIGDQRFGGTVDYIYQLEIKSTHEKAEEQVKVVQMFYKLPCRKIDLD